MNSTAKVNPLYVIKREKEDGYADFLYSDNNNAWDWIWVDDIKEVRWLTEEMLPDAFRIQGDLGYQRVARMIITAPRNCAVWDEDVGFKYKVGVFTSTIVQPGYRLGCRNEY